jgi:hypothetical protein
MMLKRALLGLMLWLLSACSNRPIEFPPTITPTLPATPAVELRTLRTERAAPTPPPRLSTEAQSACDHPYLPLRLDAQWVYTATEEPVLLSYTGPITAQWIVYNVEGDAQHATASLSPYGNDRFDCSPDTGIAKIDYSYLQPGFGTMFHLFLPPADRLQLGYSWSGFNKRGMRLEGRMSTLSGDFAETYRVIGNEPVRYQGRTYDGRQILKAAATHVAGCGYVPNCTNADGTLRQDTDWRTTSAITLTLARGVGIVEIIETEEYFGAGDQHQVTRRTYTLTDYYLPDKRVPTPVQTSATLLPTFTPLVIEPTVTPQAATMPAPVKPTIPAARRAQIIVLEVMPVHANAGDAVQLRWQAQGDRATLCPDARYTLFTPADCVDVPVSGARSFVIPADVKGNKSIEFVLTVTGAAGSSTKQGTSVALNCPQTWFFSVEPQAGVCPLDMIRTNAAIEYFERGTLIWLKEPGRYFILENQNVAPGDIRRPLSTVADPLEVTGNTADSVKPPAGLFAPTNGFGLIWRGDVEQSLGFRDQLGWALQPEFGYEAKYQCDDATPSGGRVWQTCYLTLPDGQIIALLSTGAWFWREEQQP